MLGKFACGCYRFVLETTTPLTLSAFAGATLRGGFGHLFKKVVCVWPPGDCTKCLLKNTCSYPYVFETSPPPGATRLRTLDQIPRPFVIEAPAGPKRQFQSGERFDFRLVLVGRGIDYLPYFLLTFMELGRAGLGRNRGQFKVVEVFAESVQGEERIHLAPDGKLQESRPGFTAADLNKQHPETTQLALHFLTPTRIRTQGRVQSQIDFQDLIRALLRRLSSLCYFHCGHELDVEFPGLIAQAARIRTLSQSLRWHNQERFSGRQHQHIDMSGLVGSTVFEAATPNDLAPFLPLLAAGELVHVGKGCVMGLGKYRVERKADPKTKSD